MIDVFEPLEEGLDIVTNHRHVSCIKITLSLEEMDVNDIGYQPPLPLEEIQPGDNAAAVLGRQQQQQQQGEQYGGSAAWEKKVGIDGENTKIVWMSPCALETS